MAWKLPLPIPMRPVRLRTGDPPRNNKRASRIQEKPAGHCITIIDKLRLRTTRASMSHPRLTGCHQTTQPLYLAVVDFCAGPLRAVQVLPAVMGLGPVCLIGCAPTSLTRDAAPKRL